MKVLILGGYGVFGGRLAGLLCDIEGLELIICGRDLRRAKAFCDGYRGAALARPLALDRRDVAEALRTQRPHLVVDASGPFQDYGDHRYLVIEACIAAGIDYVDFADAADFVFGVSRLDVSAKAKGIFVLSGVSSFPVLTAAVLREMAKSMDIVTAEGGIAPSPYAGIGLNVMRAVIGYAGAPVRLVRGGKPATGIGLAESRRFTVAVPGRLPLRNIRFSLVDVPDLQVIPRDHPALTDIWMGAGPVPEILHRMLNLLAKARASFGWPTLKPLSGLCYAVLNRMRFGEHRGGMYVRASGVVGGKTARMSWHLLAEGDDGPYIPSMAIEALIRKLLAGERPATGARSGADALDLDDYAELFASRQIFMGFRDDDDTGPLYQRLLGSAYETLPARVRELHGGSGERRWSGAAEVRRGHGLLANAIATCLGFPKAARQVSVTVTLSSDAEGERWTRDFGGSKFSSFQSARAGRDERLVVERFGHVCVGLALVVDRGRLYLVPRRWTLMGIPMPRCLLPSGTSFETEEDGRFRFDVEIAVPLIGLIVAYRGTLSPE